MFSRSKPRKARFLLSVCLAVGLLFACQTPYVRRDPTGEIFPTISGTSLEGSTISLPEALAGAPVLLLVGFEQESQFDLDRWALGLWQTDVALRVVEIPTIPGLVPRIISERIDGGMRRGIPEEDWASVVTVYRDAEVIARFTGNENPLPGRILLLDGKARVVFFHDRGFSTGAFARLVESLDRLEEKRD